MFKKNIKNASIVSLATFISLILGFVRDILTAVFFGTSEILEAFIVAFRIPNLFRSILGEGFTDSIALPVLSEYQKDKPRLFKLGNYLLSIFIVLLVVVTLLGIVFSKYVVIVFVPGFISQPHKFNLAVSFTRITFLYLVFIGIAVNSGVILSSLKKFWVPSINPAFLNISFIVGLLFFTRFWQNYVLVICVVIGGILQVISPLVALKKEQFVFKFDFFPAFKDKDILRMLKLFLPRLCSSAIYHLNVIIDTILSSFTQIVGEGAVAAIWYANRFIHFPIALIVIPVSQVAIVDLSYYHKEGSFQDFKKLFVFSFQNIIFFVIPITVIYLFIPQGIIDVVFTRGDFGTHSLSITSAVLFFYSLGLLFFCLTKLLVHSFYSLKDTLIPAKVTAVSLLLNVVFSVILMFPLKVGGIALGSSLSGIFTVFMLYYHLIKKIGKIQWEDTKSQFIKIVFLSVLMGVISRLLWDNLSWNKYLKMGIIMGVDFIIFISGAKIAGFKQIDYVKKILLRK